MNKVINGDCLVELAQLADESVDLIFADPPYWMRVEGVLKRPEGTDFQGCNDDWDNIFQSNEEYKDFTRQWLLECKRVLKKNGSIADHLPGELEVMDYRQGTPSSHQQGAQICKLPIDRAIGLSLDHPVFFAKVL